MTTVSFEACTDGFMLGHTAVTLPLPSQQLTLLLSCIRHAEHRKLQGFSSNVSSRQAEVKDYQTKEYYRLNQ